jgi:beta-lactam-binding protein with PASTA domain/tRNA A-37 threonylcarbamoyl transferase component Bud32
MTRMTDHIGRVLGGRYRLLTPLGSGASAHVYLADDVRLRRRVAVKVLHAALADDASFLRRFRAEAQAAASLSHPHIVAVYDWSGDDDTPFLVTEYLSGGSLRSILDAGHRLTPAQALVVGLESARALDHAHRQGFVHRDVKPANVLFGEDARLRVADFGLARAIAEAGWTEPTGAVLGTARYASPEQARGESIDGRSDVYALALLLIEAVTGTVPFSADTTIGTLMARLERSVDVPDELGPLAPIVADAGKLDAGDRIDAATFGARLVAAAEQLSRPAPLPLVRSGIAHVSGNGSGAARRDSTLLRPVRPAVAGTGALVSLAFVGTPDGVDATEVGGGTGVGPAGHIVPGPGAGPGNGVTFFAGAGSVAADRDSTSIMRRPTQVVADASSPPAGLAPAWPSGRGGDEPPASGRLSPGDRSARRLLLGAAAVAVAITLGVVGSWAYMTLQVPSHTVPDELIGAQEDEVNALVGGFGWKIDVEKNYFEGTDEGEIVGTTPEPGADVREGEHIMLTVSLGPPLVSVPQDLAGLTREEAEAALAAPGIELVAEFVEQPSDEVDEGVVIGLGDDVPDRVPKGSTVPVLISSGGDFVEIPDLEGEDVDDARAELEDLDLVVEVEFVHRPNRDDGEVIRTEPDEGEEVGAGDTVVVVAAGGTVTVPDVEGESLEDATAVLEDEGLSVGSVVGPRDGVVAATVPLDDTEVDLGTTVDLIMKDDN